MVQSSTSSQGSRSRASDIEAEVYEAVRSSGLLADLEDEDDLPEPDEEEEEEDEEEEENDEENEDDYGEVSWAFVTNFTTVPPHGSNCQLTPNTSEQFCILE